MISRLIRNVLRKPRLRNFSAKLQKIPQINSFSHEKKLFQFINFILQVIQETAGLHAIHLCVMELK